MWQAKKNIASCADIDALRIEYTEKYDYKTALQEMVGVFKKDRLKKENYLKCVPVYIDRRIKLDELSERIIRTELGKVTIANSDEHSEYKR